MFKNYNEYKLNRKKITFLKLPIKDINSRAFTFYLSPF